MAEPKLFAPAPDVADVVRKLLDRYPEDYATGLGRIPIWCWWQDHDKTIKGRRVAAYVRKHSPFERCLLVPYVESGELAHVAYLSEDKAFTEWVEGNADQAALDLPIEPDVQYAGLELAPAIFVVDYIWREMSGHQREALIDHELRHFSVDQNEDGKWTVSLVGHDLEEFTQTVARYGRWNHDLQRFMDAAQNVQYRRAGGE